MGSISKGFDRVRRNEARQRSLYSVNMRIAYRKAYRNMIGIPDTYFSLTPTGFDAA